MMLNAVANTKQGNNMLSRYINNSANHLYFMTSNSLRGVPSSTVGVTTNIQVKKNMTITKENARKLAKKQIRLDGIKFKKKGNKNRAINDLTNRILMFEGAELREGNNSLIAINTEKAYDQAETGTLGEFYNNDHLVDGLANIITAFFHEPEAHANDYDISPRQEHLKLWKGWIKKNPNAPKRYL